MASEVGRLQGRVWLVEGGELAVVQLAVVQLDSCRGDGVGYANLASEVSVCADPLSATDVERAHGRAMDSWWGQKSHHSEVAGSGVAVSVTRCLSGTLEMRSYELATSWCAR